LSPVPVVVAKPLPALKPAADLARSHIKANSSDNSTREERFRRVRFSDEVGESLSVEKPVDSAPHKPEAALQVENEVRSNPIAAISSKKQTASNSSTEPESHWNKVDRIVSGIEKAANPAELRKMMRLALEVAEQEQAAANRYSGSSSSSAKNSSASAKQTVTQEKSSPTARIPHARSLIETNAAGVDSKMKTEMPTPSPFVPPPPPPEYLVDVSNYTHRPLAAVDLQVVNNTGAKFDEEVTALQNELAQMQKNLQERMAKYKAMGKR
jgi:hypothetical protein